MASFQRALDKKTQAEADAATLQKRWSERHQTIHTDIEAKEEEVRKLEGVQLHPATLPCHAHTAVYKREVKLLSGVTLAVCS